MKRTSVAAVCLVVLSVPLAFSAFAQDKILTKIDRLDPRELVVGGFELSKSQTVSIEALGFRNRSERYDVMLSNGWILDADTRNVVWSFEDADSDRESRHIRRYNGNVQLDAGRYEVYYSTFPAFGGDRNRGDWWEFSDVFRSNGFDWEDYEDATREFEMVVRGEGKSLSEHDVEGYQDKMKEGAIVSLTALKGERYERIGLELERETELEIYCIGELRKDELYDGAWIVNTASRKKVWALDYWDSDAAGGADKNRVFKDRIKLPAGKYVLYCATDDSHHFDHWNSAPPYDPYFWGVTVQASADQAKYVKQYNYVDMPDRNVIVSMTRLRDGDFESHGFTLKKEMNLRVYAIGEGKGRDMYDGSRVIDADTRETVWEMDSRDTQHAGGAAKNRVFDDVITLPAGNYIAYVFTDGSHSYHDWNASPPHDQEHWGLTISAADGDLNSVADYSEEQDANTLVRLTGMGDNEHERRRFTLDKRARLRIYALGEGTGGRMYDYAWIENERGKVVWEMTYRMTDHAGGARKNRSYQDEITLDKGEYVIYYQSDGSHSFNHWNARPPDDFLNWGVTVKLAEGK
jgi:hypothetical protein